MTIIVRKENPPLYSDYKKYKKHLRIDFNYCCIYCNIFEKEYGGFQLRPHFHAFSFSVQQKRPGKPDSGGNLQQPPQPERTSLR